MSYLVANTKDRFSRDEAHILYNYYIPFGATVKTIALRYIVHQVVHSTKGAIVFSCPKKVCDSCFITQPRVGEGAFFSFIDNLDFQLQLYSRIQCAKSYFFHNAMFTHGIRKVWFFVIKSRSLMRKR